MATVSNRKKSGISFSPELVDELTQEHHILRQHLWDIRNFLEEKKYAQASVAIADYRSLGLKHSAQENIKIYAYLRLVYSDEDPPKESLKLRTFRKEVDLALITISHFCEEYKDVAEDEKKQKSVYSAFSHASQLIIDKMLREEKILFPLYLKNPK